MAELSYEDLCVHGVLPPIEHWPPLAIGVPNEDEDGPSELPTSELRRGVELHFAELVDDDYGAGGNGLASLYLHK